jgi:hypothetical protein
MSNEPSSWTDLINQSVHTSDDQDIGDIEAVSRNFIVVKRGIVKVHRYYIPLHKVEGWDGRVLWLKIPEEAVKSNYERDTVPDAYNYHYSSAPTLDPSNVVHTFQINMPKIPPKNQEEKPFVIATEASEQKQQHQIFRCDLCNSTFGTDDELSSHIGSSH